MYKMTNNIRKIKQDLRAYAKRCKDVHYTESLVITFLITGMLFATSNLFSNKYKYRESKTNNLYIN